MSNFKMEITLLVEGEMNGGNKPPTDTELFNRLKIQVRNWWEENANWPYGVPSKEMRGIEITSISLKSSD